MNTTELKQKADFIRKDTVSVTVRNEAGHIAPSLSCVDILVALYYDDELLRRKEDPAWPDRDRMILSKAHGCYSLYAILADIGYIKREDWECFYKGSFLSGCSERSLEHGLECTGGALGHGLPIAAGTAFGAKLQKKNFHTYCIVGDGELQEGSNWEAVQFAVKYHLSNLTIIVDANRLQAMDFLENVLTPKERVDDLNQKFSGFGCVTAECDGHDIAAVQGVLKKWRDDASLCLPQVLIARTIKGYGIKAMENVAKFHFRLPTPDELKQGTRYA